MFTFPQAEDESTPLHVGDKVRVRARVPFKSGHLGTVVAIDDYGFHSIKFSDEQVILFERDDLLKWEGK